MSRLFEDKTIDAVSVVTPNHWHALAGIWAIQAGKHASIEKPSCHTIHEGKMLIEAAKKYNLAFRTGRSNEVILRHNRLCNTCATVNWEKFIWQRESVTNGAIQLESTPTG